MQRRVAIVAVVVVVAATFSLLARPPIKDPALSHELIGMIRAIDELEIGYYIGRPGGAGLVLREMPDQLQDRFAEAQRLDKKHADRLAEIMRTTGWPTDKQVGREAVRAALTVVQRSADVDFQALAVEKMEAVDADDNPQYAFLVDQIAVRQNKPQTYGTQWTCQNGEYTPITPLAEPRRWQELRAEVGLPEFEKFERDFCASIEEDRGPRPVEETTP